MVDTIEHRSLSDRRADATREAIVDTAWQLSRREGLMGWSLRALATEVGLAAPTLYAYFDSKHAIYDAMFKQGYERLDEIATSWGLRAGQSPRQAFKAAMAEWFEFCTSDPTRYHLMFQRVIPDFVPSEHAYQASLASYHRFRGQFAELGITDEAHLDLWTAMSTGLADQQISNDPGGDRWQRLLDPAIDLYCDHVGVRPDPDDPTQEAS
jgi:AcrR family transcriptional regulator